ncbi:MAG: type I restriction enzyme HsdR N-terminal domain-containing protein [Candidatus Poribacteria bacterium]|nr:type I restriction enzyme HsdR N-terminal domain-containing protein [Candidatus Poribacteria bacterium]
MKLKENIDAIRDRLKNRIYPNEQSIRQCIVDPILNDLGWSTRDPQSVYPEYPVKDIGEVDYALCYPASEPRVFIEVKKHRSDLKPAEKQVFGYASRRSVSIAVVTDGERWRFFHPAEERTEKDCKVRELNLIIHNISVSDECFEKYLSYEAIKTGSAHKAMKQDAEKQHIAKYSQTELCQIIAQRCWDEHRSIKYLAVDLNIPIDKVRRITKTAGYLKEVEKLIMTTRSADQLTHWKRTPSYIAKLMKLQEAEAAQLIKKVRDNHCNQLT